MEFSLPTNVGPALTFTKLLAADINNDGKLDLVLFGSTTAAWMKGNGDGTFQSRTNLAGLAGSSAVLADLNNDGKLDYIFTVANQPTVGVALGKGDGTFSTPTLYASTPASTAVGVFVEVGDFNGDGKLDVAVGNTLVGSVGVLLGTGTGALGTVHTNAALVSTSGQMVVGDFNRDGNDDIVFPGGSGASEHLYTLLGKGNGTFQLPLTNAPVVSILRLRALDLDGDGILDLVALNTSSLQILHGNGDGTFTLTNSYSLGTAFAADMAIGDFNGDGKPDIAVQAGSLYVYEGLGDGSFAPPAIFTSISSGTSMAAGRFDSDQKPDVVIGQGIGVNFLQNQTLFLPPVPVLGWTKNAGKVRIIWYTQYTNHILEATSNLGDPTSWLPVTDVPLTVDCQYFLSVPTNVPGTYYRLHKH